MIRAETLNDLPADIIKRMFANNYSLLISMTDLNCNLPPLPPSVPFVGYPGGQRSTPWMRLLCSKISKHGPAGILLPRGYRIRKFPDQMRYSKLRLQRFIPGEINFILNANGKVKIFLTLESNTRFVLGTRSPRLLTLTWPFTTSTKRSYIILSLSARHKHPKLQNSLYLAANQS